MHQRTRIRYLNALSFLSQGTIFLVNLALVYYLRYSLGSSPFIVGSAAAIYNAAYLIGCLFLVPIIRGRAFRIVQISYAGMALSVALIIVTQDPAAAFILLFAYGLSMSLLWPSMEGWLASGLEGKLLSKVLSWFSFSWSSGAALSSLAASLFVEENPLGAFFLAIACFAAAALMAGIAGRLFPEKPHKGRVQETQADGDLRHMRAYSWIGVASAYAMLYAILNFFPIYAKEELGIDAETTGLLLFIRGIIVCLAFIFISRFSWWRGKEERIALSQLILSAVALLFAFADTVASIALLLIAYSVFFTLSYNLSAYFSASGSDDKVRTMRIHESAVNGGSVLGCFLGGWLYQERGYQMLWIAAASAIALIALAELLSRRLSRSS